jgi:hypothetical protein
MTITKWDGLTFFRLKFNFVFVHVDYQTSKIIADRVAPDHPGVHFHRILDGA